METEVGDLFPVAWKRSSRALSWQLREVSASVTEVTENFLGIMKISSTECEKFVKIAKKMYLRRALIIYLKQIIETFFVSRCKVITQSF